MRHPNWPGAGFRRIFASISALVFDVTYHASVILTAGRVYRFVRQECGHISPRSRVLLVGATGRIHRILEQEAKLRGYDYVTVDIDPDRLPDIIGDICASPFGPSVFDAVVLGEVLEHVQAPHLALQNIHTILRADGRLILSVPFVFPMHDRPHDYYRYTRYGLEYLLREFRDVDIRERDTWAEAINALAPRLVVEKGRVPQILAPLFVCLAFLNLPIAMLLGRLVRTNFLTSGYLVSAKR